LSIAEVAARTKIPLRQVSALEAEDYDQIPGGIFVRGHIRAAAKVVGLDPSELTAHFDEETAPPPLVPSSGPMEAEDHGPRLRMAAEPPESRPNRHLIAALLILLSIVLAIAWFGREREQPPSSRNGAAAGTAMTASTHRFGPADSGEPRPVGTIGTTTEHRAGAGGVRLSFEAQRVCWLTLTVDGQRVAYRMLQQGETVTTHMYRRAAVRTGDAGALLVSVGSGPARPLGAIGAGRSVELTPEDAGPNVDRR
jgi:cytoskeletal protein RodZ